MTETTEPQVEGEQDNKLIKGLRKQIDDLTTENKRLVGESRARAFVDAGVTEAGRKAMDRLYDGDLTTDAVRQFAEDNGIQLASESSEQTPAETPPEVPEAEQQRREAHQRVTNVVANGGTPPPQEHASELKTKMAAAERDGDLKTMLQYASEWTQADRARL